MAPDTKSFSGDFGFTLRVRRPSFDEADAVARQILAILPNEVIRIDQHKARVKMIETSPAAHSPVGEGPGRAFAPTLPARADNSHSKDIEHGKY